MMTFLTGWKALTGAGTAIAMIVAASYGVFEYELVKTEHRDQNSEEIEIVGKAVQSIRNERDLDRFLYLRKLRKTVGLGPNQHKEYCHLGARIYDGFECLPYDGRKPRND